MTGISLLCLQIHAVTSCSNFTEAMLTRMKTARSMWSHQIPQDNSGELREH